jgi:hypothetical protein
VALGSYAIPSQPGLILSSLGTRGGVPLLPPPPHERKGQNHDKKDAPLFTGAARWGSGVDGLCGGGVGGLGEGGGYFPWQNGRIAYSVFGERTDDAIYTIEAGGSGKIKVTRGYQPSYSPDGKKIAYTVFSGVDSEIYTINVGGRSHSGSHSGSSIFCRLHPMVFSCGFDKTQLTHNNKDEFTPDYSPDGKRIVYAGLEGLERNDAESDIYTIKAGGGGKA